MTYLILLNLYHVTYQLKICKPSTQL